MFDFLYREKGKGMEATTDNVIVYMDDARAKRIENMSLEQAQKRYDEIIARSNEKYDREHEVANRA